MQFKYFYGAEADTFTFYRVPKSLITDNFFKELSNEAKLLYGLMLDRMSLSVKNSWFDEENRVFIYFSVKDAMELLNIGKNKAIKLFGELNSETGIGLIEKKAQGQGKPDVIYVKSFVSEVYNSNLKKFENETSSGLESKPLEVPKSNPNNNIYNKNNSDLESNLIDDDVMEMENTIRDQIAIDALIHDNPFSKDQYEEIFELVLETMLSQEKTIVIASSKYPADLVKRKFKRLNMQHVQYVVESLQKNTSKVKNIKKYMLATLFNAPTTITSYYQAEVNHDMALGG